MSKLLIVIDAQNDFIDGALANPMAQAAVPNLVKLINEHDGDIIATHDTHFNNIQCSANWPPYENAVPYEKSLEGQKLPVPHCIKCSDGYEMNAEVKAACQAKNNEPPKRFFGIDKYTFGWDGWKKYLAAFKFDEIVIAGFCTDICVASNALILRSLFPNMKINVVENACAGVTKESHDAAILTMKMCQIDIV